MDNGLPSFYIDAHSSSTSILAWLELSRFGCLAWVFMLKKEGTSDEGNKNEESLSGRRCHDHTCRI